MGADTDISQPMNKVFDELNRCFDKIFGTNRNSVSMRSGDISISIANNKVVIAGPVSELIINNKRLKEVPKPK